MRKVLLFGATGNLGKEIAKALTHTGYEVTAVVRSEQKAKVLKDITNSCQAVDSYKLEELDKVITNHHIIISALGKSVSLNDRSKPSFRDIDYVINNNILQIALRKNLKKFVYVSVFHSERHRNLEYFKAHFDFEQQLLNSGIDYSIIKPVAFFSAYKDLFDMARKGQLVNIGKGDKKTNPIYEGDLAKIVIDSIGSKNVMIEVGGKTIYTRAELNNIIQGAINKRKKVRNVPLSLLKLTLPLIKLWDKNTYDKYAFFTEVINYDIIAPQLGEMTFEEYVKERTSTPNIGSVD